MAASTVEQASQPFLAVLLVPGRRPPRHGVEIATSSWACGRKRPCWPDRRNVPLLHCPALVVKEAQSGTFHRPQERRLG